MSLRVVCLLLTVGAAGCTDNFSVILTGNSPSATVCGGDTSVRALINGTLDVTSPLPDGTLNPGYALTPIAQSGIQSGSAGSGTNAGNPNAHLVIVQGADIELLSDGTAGSDRVVAALAGAGLASRRQRFTVTLQPGGVSGLAFPVLDARQTAVLSQAVVGNEFIDVITRSKLFGSVDTGDFESLPFDYPITLCRGCLIQNVGNCAAYPANMKFDTGGVCGPAQDKPLSCCNSTGGATLCPAVGQMPTGTTKPAP